MSTDLDEVEFGPLVGLLLARSAGLLSPVPRPGVKQQLLERLANPVVPEGFSFRFESEPDWVAHPAPGIRMKVLSLNQERGYATLLLDVAPGARSPPLPRGRRTVLRGLG